MTSYDTDQNFDMLVDDIFDGWLSVPAMGDLFNKRIQVIPEYPQYNLESTEKTNIAAGSERLESTHQSQPSTHKSPGEAVDGPIRKRRGHTKSRLGCLTCKKRKIKCQEQWPSCANCIKNGSPCRYPSVFQDKHHNRIASELTKLNQSPRPIVQLSATPSTYTGNDMRLFHHFLIAAYPCIPHEYESVWVREVPVFSHQYDYLMHCILALSGSHMSLFVDDIKLITALNHRQKAIQGLQDAFARWPPKAEEAHVMLACCYLLAFQSGYMPDAFQDHIINLRGCSLLAQKIMENQLHGIFSLEPNMKSDSLEPCLRNLPLLDQALARETLGSLAAFSPLVKEARPIEKALYTQLIECVRPLVIYTLASQQSSSASSPASIDTNTDTTYASSEQNSPFTLPAPIVHVRNPLFPSKLSISYEELSSEGTGNIAAIPSTQTQPDVLRSFDALMSSLLILTTWPQEDVLGLCSSTNKLGCLISIHFTVTRFIVSPLSAPESAMRTPIKAMVDWTERWMAGLEDDDDVEWTQYLEFPIKMMKSLRLCLDKKRGLTFGDVHDIVIKDPGAFVEGRSPRF